MSENQYAVPFLRFQFQFAHGWLEDTLRGVTEELAHWQPGGKLHPIGAEYVHVVTTEDFLVQNVLQRTAPLMATTYAAGTAGFSEPPPQGNRDAWAKALKVDLGALHGYAQAVYTATDAYLATISDPDLEKPLDLTSLGFGMQSIRFLLNLLILNIYSHSGEISCLKGLNGLQGYPG